MSSTEVQNKALRSHNEYQIVLTCIPSNEDYMPRSLYSFAQLGNWEAHNGNVNSDLKKWLGEPTIRIAKMLTVPMSTQKPATGEAMANDIEFPMMLPHEIISHVYHTHPALFSELYIGETSEEDTWGMQLEQCWKTVADRCDPRLLKHPMITSADWQRSYVPLSLHGDAMPVTKICKAASNSMDV